MAAHFLIGLDEPVPVVHHDAKVIPVLAVKAKGDPDTFVLFVLDQENNTRGTQHRQLTMHEKRTMSSCEVPGD